MIQKLLRQMPFCGALLATILVSIAHAAMAEDPDHLTPVSSIGWSSGYRDGVYARLKLHPYDYLGMVVLPSFMPESAVRLRSEQDAEIEKVDKLLLTYSVAKTSIYSATQTGHKPEDVEVQITDVEFSKPLGLRLYKLWSRMLLRTRFPNQPLNMATDGSFLEFSWGRTGWGRLVGTAYFPQKAKSPELFSDLGLALIDYAKAPPAERASAEKRIQETAEELENYLNKHPTEDTYRER